MRLDFGPKALPSGRIELPPSKSIVNRLLIMAALAGESGPMHTTEEPEDIRLMRRLIFQSESNYNAGIAGTVARFLTAFLAIKPGRHIMDGHQRMRERPIGLLVDALMQLGAPIQYLEAEGFLPIEIEGGVIHGGKISIPGDVSSQYITALLLIAPYLDQGLTIRINGELRSAPYVEMTLKQMQDAGVLVQHTGNEFIVHPGKYRNLPITAERDWSAAGYFFELMALSKGGTIRLDGLLKESVQGDAAVFRVFESLGVMSHFDHQGVTLSYSTPHQLPDRIELDCRNTPDLVQTYACTCAGLRIPARFTGVESLRIKETNRLEALQSELYKLGVSVTLKPDVLEIEGFEAIRNTHINTYNDHRMAMSFAPLALIYKGLTIADPEVVQKSFPGYWQALQGLFA